MLCTLVCDIINASHISSIGGCLVVTTTAAIWQVVTQFFRPIQIDTLSGIILSDVLGLSQTRHRLWYRLVFRRWHRFGHFGTLYSGATRRNFYVVSTPTVWCTTLTVLCQSAFRNVIVQYLCGSTFSKNAGFCILRAVGVNSVSGRDLIKGSPQWVVRQTRAAWPASRLDRCPSNTSSRHVIVVGDVRTMTFRFAIGQKFRALDRA